MKIWQLIATSGRRKFIAPTANELGTGQKVIILEEALVQ